VTDNGRVAISTGYDRTTRVWDLTTGRGVQTLETPVHVTGELAVTPDGKTAITSGDTKLYVWDLISGACLRALEGHTGYIGGLTLTPDSKIAITVSESGSDNRRLWDVGSGQCFQSFRGNPLHEAALTPDGRIVVSFGRIGAGQEAEEGIHAWDMMTQRSAFSLVRFNPFVVDNREGRHI
jgi:WD40 repeat protein